MVPFIFLIEAERGGGAGAATIWDPALPLQDNRHDPLHDQPRLCLQVDGQIKIEKMKNSHLVFFFRCGFSKVGNLQRSRITSNVSSTLTPTDQRWSTISHLRLLFCRHCLVQNRPVACPVVVFGPRFKPSLQFVGSDVPLHVSRDLEMPTQS